MASRAGVHQTTVSRIERGQLTGVPIETLGAVFSVLGARFEPFVQWRGGDLDRLLDQRHAALVEHAAAVYRANGWTVLPEVTFSSYGDRGSIDLLSLQPSVRAAAINEMKASITAVDETHRRHDVKVRLAGDIVEARAGWRPKLIGRVLVVPEHTAIRSAIARHALTFDATYPARSREVRAWIRSPEGPLAGIWFLSSKHAASGKRVAGGAGRVRVQRPCTDQAGNAVGEGSDSTYDASDA